MVGEKTHHGFGLELKLAAAGMTGLAIWLALNDRLIIADGYFLPAMYSPLPQKGSCWRIRGWS